jgi:hypothetical protein
VVLTEGKEDLGKALQFCVLLCPRRVIQWLACSLNCTKNPYAQIWHVMAWGMSVTKNAYKILVRKPDGKRPLGRPRCRWGNTALSLWVTISFWRKTLLRGELQPWRWRQHGPRNVTIQPLNYTAQQSWKPQIQLHGVSYLVNCLHNYLPTYLPTYLNGAESFLRSK